MRRALFVSIGVLALTVGVQEAAAQYGGGPDQSYRGGPDQSYRSGPGQSYGRAQEYHGPVRFGGDCVVNTDINRGYGFMKPCPAPQKPTRVSRRRQ